MGFPTCKHMQACASCSELCLGMLFVLHIPDCQIEAIVTGWHVYNCSFYVLSCYSLAFVEHLWSSVTSRIDALLSMVVYNYLGRLSML